MKTIAISDLLTFLGYTDLRAVRKWCLENNVLINKQGKSEFVFETNFKEVLELPFINKLKRKFGEEWKSVYRLYKDGNIPALNLLQEESTEKYRLYRPKNKTVSEFENKLKAYVKKKAA